MSAIAAGCACGILEFTHMKGVVFFLFCSLIVSVLLFAKMNFRVRVSFVPWFVLHAVSDRSAGLLNVWIQKSAFSGDVLRIYGEFHVACRLVTLEC